MTEIDPGLLEIIVCPNCRGPLELVSATEPETIELVCRGECGYAYPVTDGIPVLLVDEARRPVDRP